MSSGQKKDLCFYNTTNHKRNYNICFPHHYLCAYSNFSNFLHRLTTNTEVDSCKTYYNSQRCSYMYHSANFHRRNPVIPKIIHMIGNIIVRTKYCPSDFALYKLVMQICHINKQKALSFENYFSVSCVHHTSH